MVSITERHFGARCRYALASSIRSSRTQLSQTRFARNTAYESIFSMPLDASVA
jgi:hypothetical protein